MRQMSKPGSTIRVTYGKHDIGEEDQHCGYSYRSPESVGIGDIVIVPATSLDRAKGSDSTREATVTSLWSDYRGAVDRVIRVVRRRSGRYEISPIGFDMLEVTADGESLGFVDFRSEETVRKLIDMINTERRS